MEAEAEMPPCPPGELSDDQLRLEARDHMAVAVSYQLSRSEVPEAGRSYQASLDRLMELRREARRRAALN
jgi:hypothetical protein